MGNRGFVGLHTGEGYLLITIGGFILLGCIIAGAYFMQKVMARETRLRLKMKEEIEASKVSTPPHQ